MVSFTDDDLGKRVVSPQGRTVGFVSAVDGGDAYVNPFPSLSDRLQAALGWEDVERTDFVLDPEDVAAITAERIELSA